MDIRKLQIRLLNLLLFFLPFHYVIFAVLLADISVLKLWRDALMLLIIALEVVRSGGVKKDSALVVDLIFVIITVLFAILAPSLSKALNIARVYLLPILTFHAVKNICMDRQEFQSLLKTIMVSVTICCLYGLVQAYILGADFLVKLGYSNTNGVLSHTYYLSNYNGSAIGRSVQRVVSTFSAPNICAFYLCCVLILFLSVKKYLSMRPIVYYSFVFLVLITIVLTFSRSCWLALFISVLLVNIRQLWAFIRKGWVPIVLALAAVVIVLIGSESLRNALIHIINSSFSGSDTSVNNHFSTIYKAIDLVTANFWGLGLGENGPRAINYGAANLVESSYFLMMFEYGIIFGIVYFFDYLFMGWKALVRWRSTRPLSSLTACLVIFALVAYFNIPFVQEIECTGLILIILGLIYPMLDDPDNALANIAEGK